MNLRLHGFCESVLRGVAGFVLTLDPLSALQRSPGVYWLMSCYNLQVDNYLHARTRLSPAALLL
jgi:hypothetical protein